MIHKPKYITLLLSGFFLFTGINCSQFKPGEHAMEKIIDEGTKAIFTVAATQMNEEFTHYRTKNRALTPAEESQERRLKSEEDKAAKDIDLSIEQKKLAEIQIKEQECELFNKQMTAVQNMKNSDPSNPEYIKLNKRLDLKLKELTKDLPEIPAEEEPKKSDLDKPTNNDEQKSNGFLAYCFLAAVAAKDAVDVIADCSFKNITDLDCFKNTFVDKHHIGINRVLVLTTITVLTYKGYSLYKKYMAQRNEKDEDIFNDDLD